MTNSDRSNFPNLLSVLATSTARRAPRFVATVALAVAAAGCGGAHGSRAGYGDESAAAGAPSGDIEGGYTNDTTSQCPYLSDPEPSVRALATDKAFEYPIALDDKYIYATRRIDKEHREFVRLDRAGGEIEVVAETEPVDSMVVDDDAVYVWGRYSGVFKIAKDGSEPQLLVPWEHSASDTLAIDDKNVYVMDRGYPECDKPDGALYGFDKRTGKAALTVKDLTCPSSAVADGKYVYVAEAGGLFANAEFKGSLKRVPTSGGTTEVLAQGFDVGAAKMIIDGDYVYLTEVAHSGDVPPGSPVRVPRNGGALERLWTPCTRLAAELLGVVDNNLIYSSLAGYTRLDLASKQDYDIGRERSVNIFVSVSIMDGDHLYSLDVTEHTLSELVRR